MNALDTTTLDRWRAAVHDLAAETLSLRQHGELTGIAAQRLLARIDRLNEDLRGGSALRSLPALESRAA
jgi:hypothetical protein